MSTRLASCNCGQLRLECEGDPLKISLCHCIQCQRRTGSAFGIAAFFERSNIRVEGVSRQYIRTGESGYDVTFHFCCTCGSTVYWEPARYETLIAVAVGAFGDPEFPPPSQAVWNEARHKWVQLPPGVVARTGN